MLWILETHFPQNIENIEPRETAQHSYKKRCVYANFIDTSTGGDKWRDLWHELQSETLFIGAEGPAYFYGWWIIYVISGTSYNVKVKLRHIITQA